ncbi:serine acetyltransferase [Hanstruepera neustonica]|nr:serine acetyltransferase [Hanstruepera neustonica]
MTRRITHIIKKLLIRSLYKRYVSSNAIIQADMQQTLEVRGSEVASATPHKQFDHLMLYYPEFAFLFFWRIKQKPWFYKLFAKNFNCKIFKSTPIGGGLMCYHPFGTVINAQSIGKNFQFRNGLTIGNKHNDNSLLPVIGDDVTVGAQVVIIGAINIGNHVVIGAGSVVVKDVPSHSVVAGNPAKVIRRLSHE